MTERSDFHQSSIFNNQFSIHIKYHESFLFPSRKRRVLTLTFLYSIKETMTKDKAKGKRFVGLFLLGCLLFNFPILSLFNHKVIVFGIPLLYLYMFSIWFILIVFIYLITRFTEETKRLKFSKRDE